MNYSTTR